MAPVPGGRFCKDCQKVVHDLSGMSEDAARALLESTPKERVCVRYVYDAHSGDVVFGARASERRSLIPEHRLARLKSRVALAAAIAAPLLVEACGGNDGNYQDRAGEPWQAEAGLDEYGEPLPDAGVTATESDAEPPLDAGIGD